MIKLVENDSITAMAEYCAGDPFGCRIMATYNTYGLDEDFAQFWIQKRNGAKGKSADEIVAVIGRLDDGLTICTRGGSDDEELDLFVHQLVGENGALRPTRQKEVSDGLVMRLDREVSQGASPEAEINPPCEDIYTVIESSPELGFEIPNFETFYKDMKRRVKAGSAITAIKRDNYMPVSCAAMHIAGGVALMVMCATSTNYQGKGNGLACMKALISRIPNNTDIYVMCLPALCEFYEKIGFKVVSGFVY